jgi:predicted kinase
MSTGPGCRGIVRAVGTRISRESGLPAGRLFLMVGLPLAGKTTRAREIEDRSGALRLTPDEWMVPLFGDSDAAGKRDVLEGRFVWLAMRALGVGTNVVLDFGVWSKDERSALRYLASSLGATCELVYLEVSEKEQAGRAARRAPSEGVSTFRISHNELARFRRLFQAPGPDELDSTEIGPPPHGFADWALWAAERWPTSAND